MVSMIISLALAATPATGTASPPAKPAKPRKVCERVETTVGSRLSPRVCHTVVEPAEPKSETEQTTTEKSPSGAAN